jgi:hypothetical protein
VDAGVRAASVDYGLRIAMATSHPKSGHHQDTLASADLPAVGAMDFKVG